MSVVALSSTQAAVARARHGASVARGARALKGCGFNARRRRASSTAVRAAGGEDDTPEEAAARAGMSAARKRSPKPLPSTFGEGKSKGKVKGFEDPFEKSSGSKPPAASPFDMPASALDAATSTKPPDSPASPASPASPFGAATPAAAKPASPFGGAAEGGEAKPASPFGAPAAPASPFGAAAPANPAAKGASPFAQSGAAKGASPFAQSGAAKGASPFAQSGAANPFGEATASRAKPKPAEEDTRSAWEKLPKPAMAQVVIVLSFTTIISLMLATFWVVVQVRPRRVFAL